MEKKGETITEKSTVRSPNKKKEMDTKIDTPQRYVPKIGGLRV